MEDPAGHSFGLGTQPQVAGGTGTAEVQVTVLQAGFFTDLHVLVNLERQGIGGVKNHHLVRDDFDLSRGQRRVLIALRTLADGTRHLQDVFVPEPVEHFFLADNHLGHAGRVTEVDECNTTVITAAAHPAGQGNGLSNVLGTK